MNLLTSLPVSVQTFGLLLLSNLFMTLVSYTKRNTCRVSQNPVNMRASSQGKCPNHLL